MKKCNLKKDVNSLNFKVFIHLMFIAVIPLVFNIVLNQVYFSNNFWNLEKKTAVSKTQQIREIFFEGAESLEKIAKEFGVRTETYERIQTESAAWFQVNLVNWLVSNFDVNLILVANNAGTVYGQYGISPEFVGSLLNESPLANLKQGEFSLGIRKYPCGLKVIDDQLYIIGASPILASDYSGGSRGILIIGKLVDSNILKQVNRQYDSELVLAFVDKIFTQNGYIEDQEFLKKLEYSEVFELNGEKMVGAVSIKDVTGKNIGHLAVIQSRDAFLTTMALVKKSAVIVSIITLSMILGLGLKLRNIIVNPIRNLEMQISRLGNDKNLGHVQIKGSNELMSLGRAFNQMADRINLHREENKSLKELSITDGLTSLYNHKHLYEYLKEKGNLECKQMAVLFGDIDNFKVINDAHGHVFGDRLLRLVSKIIMDVIDECGVAFRYGGEEFVILLEECDIDQAFQIAETIRLRVASSQEIQQYAVFLPITISIGLAIYPDDSRVLDDLVEKADKAMYHAKQSGRNQCKIYSKDLESRLDHNLIKKQVKEELLMDSVYALATAVDTKDSYTGKHSESVTYYALLLAERLNLDHNDKHILTIGGLLHDCGKIGISDDIIHKPGLLTDMEMQIMKKHPSLGSKIIKYLIKTPEINACVKHHHERWDGKGYPDHLVGDTIPYYARIICIADAYHAMISDRPYRKALTVAEALNELEKNRGTQFDPELVEIFIKAVQENLNEGKLRKA